MEIAPNTAAIFDVPQDNKKAFRERGARFEVPFVSNPGSVVQGRMPEDLTVCRGKRLRALF